MVIDSTQTLQPGDIMVHQGTQRIITEISGGCVYYLMWWRTTYGHEWRIFKLVLGSLTQICEYVLR